MVMSMPGLNQSSSSMLPTMIFAAIPGESGAFISRLVSKRMALQYTNAQLLETPANSAESWLIAIVR
jgi:hypothetical protein